MSKTKQKILDSAILLFNQNGVANVSIRQIAKEAAISHGNLIYHYPNKESIVLGIHEKLLEQAVQLNQLIDPKKFDIKELHTITKTGFEIVLQFRFLFFDLLYISNTMPKMREILREVEKTRSDMYMSVIQLSIKNSLMRGEEYDGEYVQLIHRIKIFSDHWITSSAIYDTHVDQHSIGKYAELLLSCFYPYLTPEGKKEIRITNVEY